MALLRADILTSIQYIILIILINMIIQEALFISRLFILISMCYHLRSSSNNHKLEKVSISVIKVTILLIKIILLRLMASKKLLN